MLPEYHWIAGERLSLFLSHLVEPRWSPKMVQFSVKLFVLNGGDLSSRQKVVVRPTLAMYLIITLLASVFPEPDSPGIISNINYRTGIRVETQT